QVFLSLLLWTERLRPMRGSSREISSRNWTDRRSVVKRIFRTKSSIMPQVKRWRWLSPERRTVRMEKKLWKLPWDRDRSTGTEAIVIKRLGKIGEGDEIMKE